MQITLLNAYQDGAQFYRESDGALLARYPDSVKNDHDMAGAERARALFASEFPQHVEKEAATAPVQPEALATAPEGQEAATAPRAQTLAVWFAQSLGAYRRAVADLGRIDAGHMDSSWRPLRQLWRENHYRRLESCNLELPRGGGFDHYPAIDRDESKPDALRFYGSYHKMNSDGFYTGWQDYRITVRPSFEFGITVSVNLRGELGDYIADAFSVALSQHIPEEHFPAHVTSTESEP